MDIPDLNSLPDLRNYLKQKRSDLRNIRQELETKHRTKDSKTVKRFKLRLDQMYLNAKDQLEHLIVGAYCDYQIDKHLAEQETNETTRNELLNQAFNNLTKRLEHADSEVKLIISGVAS